MTAAKGENKMKIVLASASPRREELLRRIYPDFMIAPADVDETVPEKMKAEEVPLFLAQKKAAKAVTEHPDALVITADTVVLAGNEILGKPKHEEDAARMLHLLSGNTHRVLTGCCVSFSGKSRAFTSCSFVTFYPLSEQEIGEYIKTGEPFGKAGAYAIQGKAALFVKGIEGDFYNIVGLPVAQLKREIALLQEQITVTEE